MEAFDDAIGNMQVQIRANQAKADSIASKLGDVKASSVNYQINDNENVQKLRSQIVGAEVNLVGLRQQYTNENPVIINAEETLKKLRDSLTSEVNTAVASKYTSINPTQAALIAEEANAKIAIDVAEESEKAIAKRKDEKEQELNNFPKDVLEYMNLERDTVIKETIYTDLVKKYEQSRIQQAMDSMDIQIVDRASLPFEEKPEWPRPKLMVVAGFVLGCLIVVGNALMIYKKNEDL